MQVGVIDLNSTGLKVALSFKEKNYGVVVYDTDAGKTESVQQYGITHVNSLKNFVEALSSKRIIWLMIEDAEVINETLDDIKHYLAVSDIVIGGGNSFYKDSIRRAKDLEALQLDYLDCGIQINELNSMSMTIGGNRFAFNYCEQLFKDLVGDKYLFCGKSGAGHFVNGIYGDIRNGKVKSINEAVQEITMSPYNIDKDKVLNYLKLIDTK